MFGVLKCMVAASVRYKCAARLLGSRLRRLSLHVQTEVSLRSADQDRCSSVCSARPKTGFDLKCQTEAWHQSYRVDRGTRAEGQFSGANASKASVRRSGPIRLTAASVLLRKLNRAVCISPFAPRAQQQQHIHTHTYPDPRCRSNADTRSDRGQHGRCRPRRPAYDSVRRAE